MSHHAHRADAGAAGIDVHVLVVSSTRTLETDTGGRALAERLAAAGHRAASREVVDDDLAAIRAAVRRLADADAPAVILTGGTGISGRDVTPEALAPLLAPRLDGFGEQLRALSSAQIAAAGGRTSSAMLSRACAGLVGRTVVFAVPGSPAACALAVDALIGPELVHLVQLARTDRAAPGGGEVDAEFEVVDAAPASATAAATAPTGSGPPGRPSVGLSPLGGGEAPPVELDAPWRRALAAWGGAIDLGGREPLPEAMERLAPVVDVLHQAGAVGVVTLGDGRRYGVYGFPDLVRPSAKVVLVGEGGELGHVIVAHRPPGEVVVGTCAHHGPTPLVTEPLGALAERVTGRAWATAQATDVPFAVAAQTVWALRGRRVFRWDGRTERDDGTPSQVLATLLLDWTAR